MYITHLKEWLKYFTLNQILILDGEKLIIDPYNVVQKAESFLNVPKFIKKESFVYNEEKGFICIQRSPNIESKCLGESKGSAHPYIAQKFLNKLKEFYKPLDNELFQTIKSEHFW